jgi:hypothetical protein
MVARLTPDQKVACSSHVGVNMNVLGAASLNVSNVQVIFQFFISNIYARPSCGVSSPATADPDVNSVPSPNAAIFRIQFSILGLDQLESLNRVKSATYGALIELTMLLINSCHWRHHVAEHHRPIGSRRQPVESCC